ncbi:MAG: hypothetical protein HYX74_11910 [Acidobacteria bacterium]|nr:hypothetical protein [Acidobacteriota bacterium]
MKGRYSPIFFFHGPRSLRQSLLPALLLALAAAAIAAATAGEWAARPQQQPQSLSATEFARLIGELSEEAGYFHSDNFTSNETSYLHVVDKLRQLGASGGAYIGVGPEQNFTYIAKIRPRIAFIVDIRRQAMIQHLMFKAVFHLSADRTQFLARLLSRPLPEQGAPAADAPVEDLVDFFSRIPGEDQACERNLAAIRKLIEKDFHFSLSEEDQARLEYVYRSFRYRGLNIAYRMNRYWGSYFPTLKDLIAETDLQGRPGNFLSNAGDYDFVRSLHLRNRVIPVVGNFAGKKALAAVGDYLREHGLTVTAFYTSNVERYLFGDGSFSAFADNVRKLPIDNRSLFIRSVAGGSYHPARLPGHRSVTLLQPMMVFIRDFEASRYGSYRDLVMTHYIAATEP